jgi:1-acyl-sn-glycerol-3-phosphate acyltransferase
MQVVASIRYTLYSVYLVLLENMKALSKLKLVVKAIYSIYALLLFAVVIIALFPVLLLIMPLGKIRGGNIMYDLFRVMGNFWLRLIGIRHSTTYEYEPDQNKQYIFVTNHISYIDAVIIILCIKHHFRPIGKHDLLKIPIFGFLYKYCVITVNRSNVEDRARSLNDLRKVIAKNISVLVFPEGTFNETSDPLKSMFDGAFKLAVETGKSIQPILLLDAFDRLHFNSIFSLTPGRSRGIHLNPINPADYPGVDAKELKAITAKVMSDKLIQYKASWLDKKYFE